MLKINEKINNSFDFKNIHRNKIFNLREFNFLPSFFFFDFGDLIMCD